MKNYYTDERNIQIIISLLKSHNIKKIIASPGTTNVSFEVYSAVDERSAGYMACGLAAESQEPVVLTCTGATASRNYVPAMTEAYYRKLPVLALTATQHRGRIGQNIAQVLDRTNEMNDICKYEALVSIVHNAEDEEACCIAVNNALLELRHHGFGPVIIDYETTYSNDYSVKELPPVHTIYRIDDNDVLPKLEAKRIAIFVGAHLEWNTELTSSVEEFCEKYNAVVICDQDSNYHGKYGISGALICSQSSYKSPCRNVDLLIDIGDVSGAYWNLSPKESWRVNTDGAIRQRGGKINYVFEMNEINFFKKYNEQIKEKIKKIDLFNEWQKEDSKIRSKIGNIPFSNIWLSQQLWNKIPENSVIHLGILNTLRSWDLNPLITSSLVYSNTGGFGIDGTVSSLIGSALASPNKIHYGFFGDLAFFYDLNAIGNRHVGNNIRILVVNNGRGIEFRNYNNRAEKYFGEEADKFMAAAGHFGNQSKDLLKHYSQDLGFKYLSASNKEEFMKNLDVFISKDSKQPVFFEVFTNYIDESNALNTMYNLITDQSGLVKTIVKKVVGQKGINKIKKIINKRGIV